MPELPEIRTIASQMDRELRGRIITEVEILQEKCLNMPKRAFMNTIIGKPIEESYSKGKWIFTRLRGGTYLLINLGMGGDIIWHAAGDALPEKYQFLFALADSSFIHVRFSWFGFVHAAEGKELKNHQMTAVLGIDPLSEEFTYQRFAELLAGKKGGIKAWLMDQKNVAGIGNVYIQDILFKSRLHPNRKIPDIREEERRHLYKAITGHLKHATKLGGLKYERDFYGAVGRYQYNLVGHKPGSPCPACGSAVEEIRTGSTRSYICPNCQK